MDKRQKHLKVTRKLLIYVGISLLITVLLFSISFFGKGRFLVSWLVFQCGIIGGFVSIQQRLKDIDKEELALLAESWTSILLIPVYGGVFSLLLYIVFLAKVLQGSLFPEFYIPEFSTVVSDYDIQRLLTQCYPKTGPDFAKLIFWSFVAGFSERFVPQIISNITSKAADDNNIEKQ